MSFLQIPSTKVDAIVVAPEDPAIHYTFPLDVWQQQAVSAIHKGENVLVTAKTGSGNTAISIICIRTTR
jgi:superfamily II RNA helicase